MQQITSVLKHSHKEISVEFTQLRRKAIEFLEHYATPALTSASFTRLIGSGRGVDKLNRLSILPQYPSIQ